MAHSSRFAFATAAALALLACGFFSLTAAARPQDTAAPTSSAAQAAKPVKKQFEVLHMMPSAIQVRSVVRQQEIHTFTYSAEIQQEMLQLMNKGGYQFGDKVEIWYQPGAEIALKIKGKPSKPS